MLIGLGGYAYGQSMGSKVYEKFEYRGVAFLAVLLKALKITCPDILLCYLTFQSFDY